MKDVRNRAAKSGDDAPNKSWVPGQKGQGGEGFSDGCGGETAVACGISYSVSLPSPEILAEVLR